MNNVTATMFGCFEIDSETRHFGVFKDSQIGGLGLRISKNAIESGRYQDGKLKGFGQRIEFGKLFYKGYFLNNTFDGEGNLFSHSGLNII